VKSLLKRIVPVLDREIPALFWAFLQMFCLIAANYLLRPVRESLGSTRGSSDYNWLYLGTFVAMAAGTTSWSFLVARFPIRRFIAIAYEVFALSFVLLWALLRWHEGAAAELGLSYAFFIWYSVYNLFVVSMFWSRAADLFSPDQGRRLFAFVAAGGSLGAIAGSSLVKGLVDLIGTINMLLLPALLLQGVVFCAWRLALAARGSGAEPAQAAIVAERGRGSAWSGFRGLLSSRLLALIALYVLCSTFCGTFVYTMQGDVARAAFPDRDARTGYYGTIDLSVNVLSFLASAFLAARLFRWIGVGAALFLLPAAYVAGYGAAAVAPVLGAVAALEIARRALGYGITTPARETLFTGVARDEKYRAKNAIDTFIWRGGDVVAVWLMELLFWIGPGESAPAATKVALVAAAGVPVALIWIGVAAALRRSAPRAVTAET
jgi:ATP:ADP antiporter, AAA family